MDAAAKTMMAPLAPVAELDESAAVLPLEQPARPAAAARPAADINERMVILVTMFVPLNVVRHLPHVLITCQRARL